MEWPGQVKTLQGWHRNRADPRIVVSILERVDQRRQRSTPAAAKVARS